MSIHESAENYLEAILVLKKRLGYVRSIDIVNELGFSKPSVSIAMKNLREKEFITMSPSGQITLTEQGEAVATATYERHVFFKDWLISLGVNEKTAGDDACRIEHAISKESFDAIKRYTQKKQG